MLLSVYLSADNDLAFFTARSESDNVLYPNSSMDAIYDDSDIVNFKYYDPYFMGQLERDVLDELHDLDLKPRLN